MSSTIDNSTNYKEPNSNTILLTLPNISLGENESEESDRNYCSAAGTGECTDKEPPAVINLIKQFKGECESVAYSAVDEEGYFCHQHLTNKDRLSPELQDVYKLLMQLPSFSHSSWSGFNNAAGQKGTIENMRKVSSLGKTRRSAFTTAKVGKFYKESYTSSTSDTIKEAETLRSGVRRSTVLFYCMEYNIPIQLKIYILKTHALYMRAAERRYKDGNQKQTSNSGSCKDALNKFVPVYFAFHSFRTKEYIKCVHNKWISASLVKHAAEKCRKHDILPPRRL